MGLWSTKSIAKIQADPILDAGAPSFRRVLGSADLTAIGIGAILGAGIFVVTGTASAQFAGPAIVLSFIVAGLGCLMVAFCYAELASMMPVAGTAYTYSHAAFGELVAWMTGWVIVLEFLFGAAAVSVSWSGYFVALLRDLGVNLSAAWTQSPFMAEGWRITRVPGAIVNVPAVLLVALLTAIVVAGIRPTAIANRLIVVVKVLIVVLTIVFGFVYLNPSNWQPFVPENGGSFGRYGWSGVLRGAATVFFAFIGFDVVSAAAQEARDPHRDVPIGILSSLAICSILYILMALVMTGLTRYPDLNAPHPLLSAFITVNPSLVWLTYLIRVAILAGLASVALAMLMGQPRVLFAMSRDRLLPRRLGTIGSRSGAPVTATIVTGALAAVIAGMFPIGMLMESVSLGALVIFVVVCLDVLALRYREPNVRRPFRAPLVPLVPVLGIVFSVATMLTVPLDSWIRLLVWNAAGLVAYLLLRARVH